MIRHPPRGEKCCQTRAGPLRVPWPSWARGVALGIGLVLSVMPHNPESPPVGSGGQGAEQGPGKLPHGDPARGSVTGTVPAVAGAEPQGFVYWRRGQRYRRDRVSPFGKHPLWEGISCRGRQLILPSLPGCHWGPSPGTGGSHPPWHPADTRTSTRRARAPK